MPAGNIGDLAVAIQAAKGTPAPAALFRVPITGGGLNPTREVTALEGSTANRVRMGAFVARARAEGSPTIYAMPDSLGAFLFAALGAKAVTGAADPYEHTFTLAPSQPYMTFWRNVGGIQFERFPDCKVSQLVLRSAEGAAMTAEIGIIGLRAQNLVAAVGTPALEVGIPFVHYDAEQQLLVEGTPVASMSSVTTTITTGATVIPGDNLGGYAIAEGMVGIRFETSQLIEDGALWRRLHYGSATPGDEAAQTRGLLELGGAPAGLSLKWTKRNNAGVAVTPERSLEINAPRIVIANIAGMETNNNGEPLRATVTYDAYQPGSGSALTAILRNAVATYPAT
ncbi:MAG TPA: phage tail tube protein [Candidatus Limnocylindrales bacterium]|nr:phage tail tube protein [Candidatus Limnocylindrales bacterium]